MNNSLTKITYETSLGTVELDFQTVKNYLVRGQADKITDQEVILFMKTCQAQKLNPFAQGEAYLIKFGSDPAQMVVGKDAYMRRAEENPAYPKCAALFELPLMVYSQIMQDNDLRQKPYRVSETRIKKIISSMPEFQ